MLLLGDPGSGKTTFAKALAAEYLRRSRGIVAVANSKGEPWPTAAPWPAESHEAPADLVARPPVGRAIVFTPPPFGDSLDMEEIARWQWRLAARGWPSLVIWDEIGDACRDGQWQDTADGARAELPRVWTHGRRVGISAVAGAQFAHLVPREAFETCGMICCWRQAGNALGILARRHYLQGDVERIVVEDAIRSLPGDNVPPAERGAFVVLRRGRPWDGRTYRL